MNVTIEQPRVQVVCTEMAPGDFGFIVRAWHGVTRIYVTDGLPFDQAATFFSPQLTAAERDVLTPAFRRAITTAHAHGISPYRLRPGTVPRELSVEEQRHSAGR